jgi:hypothetical protein
LSYYDDNFNILVEKCNVISVPEFIETDVTTTKATKKGVLAGQEAQLYNFKIIVICENVKEMCLAVSSCTR